MTSLSATDAATMASNSHISIFKSKVEHEVRTFANAGYYSCVISTHGHENFAVSAVADLLVAVGYKVSHNDDQLMVSWVELGPLKHAQ